MIISQTRRKISCTNFPVGYVDTYATICVEDLNIKYLKENGKSRGLRRSIHSASWGRFYSYLAYKAASAGTNFIQIDPRNTTQMCSHCGSIVKKDLSVRVHDCPYCGFVADRDYNAAVNIHRVGMEQPCEPVEMRPLHHISVMQVLSMKQEAPPPSARGSIGGCMFRVLVVDHDPAFLELTLAWLARSEDMQVATTTSPVQALDMLARTRYDAVVAGYEMPEMDGITLLKEIRHQGMKLPFIIISGRGREEVVIEALNGGADFYLRKGGDPSAQFAELRNMILQAVARSRAEAVYQSVFEHTGTATIIIEGDMTVSLANTEFLRLTGYRREEVEGKLPWTAFVAAEDVERLTTHHRNRRLVPGLAPRTYGFRLVDREGTPREMYMTVGLIPRTDRSVASMINISDRRRFEEELRAAHEEMAAAFEQAKASEESLAAQYRELEDYQATLRGIIDFLPDPTFVLDREGRVVVWNRAIEAVTGIQKERIIGSRAGAISELTAGLFSPLLAETVLAQEGGESVSREVCISPANGGEETYLWGKASPLYDAQGRVSGAIESLRDVTGLKRMEAQIRRRVDLERMVSSISTRFVALDLTDLDDALDETIRTLGLFLDVDRSYIFRFSSDHTLADNTHEWCAEGVDPQIAVMQAIQTDSLPWGLAQIQVGRTICLPALDDLPAEAAAEREFLEQYGVVSVILVPVVTAGEVVGLMGFETIVRERSWSEDDIALLTVVGNLVGDLLGRVRGLKRLRESEERFRTLVERSHDCYIRRNTVTSVIEYISPSWERLIGYPREECMDDPGLIERLIHPDDREVFCAMLQEPEADRLYTFRALRRDRRYAWLEVCTIPVYGDDGEVVAVEYAVHDINAWKQAELALIEANRKLGLMNSIVRHDILNQVTVVLGYIALLRDLPLDPEVDRALEKQQAAAEIIQSLIEFTRDYQDLGVRAPRWLQIEPLVRSAARALRPRGIRIVTDLKGVSVYADPLLSSVFYNLLENAMRHGKTVTEIQVTAVPEGSGALIIWEDNGVGVPSEIKDRIFERGFGSHTGLGLFLVREILSITGITIRETGTPGEGARFEILVPEDCVRF